MELIQIDSIDPEPLQTRLARLLEVIGSSSWNPISGLVANQASLGRDDEIRRVRMEGLCDEVLGDFRTVAVGGIDQLHAELDRAPQHAFGFLAVLRFAP